MTDVPTLALYSVKIPVADLEASRRWYADVLGLREALEWPDDDGVVRGIAYEPLGTVTLSLREHPEAAAATRDFGFVNLRVPAEDDLLACARHLDALGIWHTEVMSGARGRLIGFRDLDGHQLSFYAETTGGDVRDDSVHSVRRSGESNAPETTRGSR